MLSLWKPRVTVSVRPSYCTAATRVRMNSLLFPSTQLFPQWVESRNRFLHIRRFSHLRLARFAADFLKPPQHTGQNFGLLCKAAEVFDDRAFEQ